MRDLSEWVLLRLNDVLHLILEHGLEHFRLTAQIRVVVCLREDHLVAEIEENHEVLAPALQE